MQTPVLMTADYPKAYGYLSSDLAVIRPDDVSDIDYIASVRQGEVPWMSRQERHEKLDRCQAEWTTRNMMTMTELLNLA